MSDTDDSSDSASDTSFAGFVYTHQKHRSASWDAVRTTMLPRSSLPPPPVVVSTVTDTINSARQTLESSKKKHTKVDLLNSESDLNDDYSNDESYVDAASTIPSQPEKASPTAAILSSQQTQLTALQQQLHTLLQNTTTPPPLDRPHNIPLPTSPTPPDLHPALHRLNKQPSSVGTTTIITAPSPTSLVSPTSSLATTILPTPSSSKGRSHDLFVLSTFHLLSPPPVSLFGLTMKLPHSYNPLQNKPKPKYFRLKDGIVEYYDATADTTATPGGWECGEVENPVSRKSRGKRKKVIKCDESCACYSVKCVGAAANPAGGEEIYHFVLITRSQRRIFAVKDRRTRRRWVRGIGAFTGSYYRTSGADLGESLEQDAFEAIRKGVGEVRGREEYVRFLETVEKKHGTVRVRVKQVKATLTKAKMGGGKSVLGMLGLGLSDFTDKLGGSHAHDGGSGTDEEDDEFKEPARTVAQIWKDMERDTILLNGVLHDGSVIGAAGIISCLVLEIMDVSENKLTGVHCIKTAKDIVQNCNRTRSGGDTYYTVSKAMAPGECILCPDATTYPIVIDVEKRTRTRAGSEDAGVKAAANSSPSSTRASPMPLSGWCEKRGLSRKGWKRRFFTLTDGVLMYFEKERGLPRGKVLLSDVLSLDCKGSVLYLETGERKMQIKPEMNDDSSGSGVEVWKERLLEHIKEWEGVEEGEEDGGEELLSSPWGKANKRGHKSGNLLGNLSNFKFNNVDSDEGDEGGDDGRLSSPELKGGGGKVEVYRRYTGGGDVNGAGSVSPSREKRSSMMGGSEGEGNNKFEEEFDDDSEEEGEGGNSSYIHVSVRVKNMYKVVTDDPMGDEAEDTWAKISGTFQMNFEVGKFGCAKGEEIVEIMSSGLRGGGGAGGEGLGSAHGHVKQD